MKSAFGKYLKDIGKPPVEKNVPGGAAIQSILVKTFHTVLIVVEKSNYRTVGFKEFK